MFGIVYFFRVLYLDLQSNIFFAEILPLLSRALQLSLIQSRQTSKTDRPTDSDRNKQVIFERRTELIKQNKNNITSFDFVLRLKIISYSQ
jgi:hypothetical protein